MLDSVGHDLSPAAPSAAAALQSWNGLLERLPVGIYSCDRDGLLVRYNQRAVELWGRTPSLGDPAQRFCGACRTYRPDGKPLPRSESPMAELLRTGASIRDREVLIERPDGSRITILASLDPLTDGAGRIVGGVSCFQDVTARKAAEAALREREQRFRELLEALPAAIYNTDAAGRITFYNQAAVELWGCRPALNDDQWCGSWRLYWPDGRPLAHDQCPMAIALKENRPVRDAEAVAERPDGTRVPFIPYPTPLHDDAGQLIGAVNMLVDITHRKRAEDTQKLLIGELNHRVKNTLAIVQAIARQTLLRAKSPAEFVPSFNGRLQALSSAHTLLTQSVWRGADLLALVREQLLLGAADDSRIICSGPEVVLPPPMALRLAMVLHELGTNARKYGALSVADGRLTVGWSVETSRQRLLRLRWVETGGPRVNATTAPGFGTVLIEQSLRPHGGEARMLSEAIGISWQIDLPLPAASSIRHDPLQPGEAGGIAPHPQPDERPADQPSAVAGRRILVVEDEPLLALDIASSLSEAGISILGPAGTVEQAMRLAEGAPFDGALLDANLNGQPVDEIAAVLTRRNIPFAFVTGYGRESLPRAFRSVAVVTKPFGTKELIDAVRGFAAPGDDSKVLPLRGRTAAL